MPVTTLRFRRFALVVLAIVGTTLLAAAAIEQQPASGKTRVALTFDDLPAHGPVPTGLTRLDIAQSIIGTLQKYGAPPTYGFINARQLERTPADIDVLKAWRSAGFPLGNHAYSHMDLHANTAEAFEQDVLANEAMLRTLMGDGDWHWFRYPYLREGDTPEKYRAVRAALAANKYRIAQVTLDFSDYAYNDPYARCLARNDAESIEWLKESYLDRAQQSLSRGQDLAHAIVGREIKHVMLLHIGGFETVMLPRLLDLLKDRGFELTTLEDAQSDEIYTRVPVRDSNWSGTLLNQLRPRPATPSAALSDAQEPPAPPSDDTFARLAALCK